MNYRLPLGIGLGGVVILLQVGPHFVLTDELQHFLGGMGLALVFQSSIDEVGELNKKWYLVMFLGLALFWEIWELEVIGYTLWVEDTILDITLAILGSMFVIDRWI